MHKFLFQFHNLAYDSNEVVSWFKTCFTNQLQENEKLYNLSQDLAWFKSLLSKFLNLSHKLISSNQHGSLVKGLSHGWKSHLKKTFLRDVQ